MTWDIFSGKPTEPTREPRWWDQTRAAKWHREAVAKAQRICALERDIPAATDPLARHSLEVRLAALTGVAPPEYVEPPPQAEPAPTQSHEDEARAQAYLRKARRRQGRN